MGKRTGKPRGRPKGSISKSTRAIVEAAQAGGKTMLEIMTEAARNAWDRARAETDDAKRSALEDHASALASRASPYMHPKLAAVEHSGDMTIRHEDALKELE